MTRATDLAAAIIPQPGERTQTIEGVAGRVAIRSNRAWREMAESAAAIAYDVEAFVTAVAEDAGAIRSGMAATRLAQSNNGGARHTAAALDRMALAMNDSDRAGAYAALSEFVTGAVEAESDWRKERDACNAHTSALADYRRERDSLADRNANQETTIRTLDSEVKRLRADLETADTVAARLGAEVAEYRRQRDAEGARAVAADRQLAEYRSLMSALPLGMARAYPAAFPLLRAYLADSESDK